MDFLGSSVDDILKSFEEGLDVIKERNLHWALREWCRTWLHKQLTEPAKSVLGIRWDCQNCANFDNPSHTGILTPWLRTVVLGDFQAYRDDIGCPTGLFPPVVLKLTWGGGWRRRWVEGAGGGGGRRVAGAGGWRGRVEGARGWVEKVGVVYTDMDVGWHMCPVPVQA